MNREEYRKAFDEIPFSADFQERTVNLLRQRARELEKENNTMYFSRPKKLAVTIAAALALLAVSVSAAVLWLTPSQVAEHFDQPLLAQAFQAEGAVLMRETVESGDYAITLLGLVSGEDLTTWDNGTDTSHTYAVLALRRLDGEPLEQESFDFSAYTLTPLAAGYAPTAVNNWTLDAFASGFAEDGVYYYLLDTRSVEIFAGRTVYLAFYEGGAPGNSIFTLAENGEISFAEDFDGVQALFTLPLDKSLADPEAAEAFVASTGLNNWSNDRDPETAFETRLEETEDGTLMTISPAGEDGWDLNLSTP